MERLWDIEGIALEIEQRKYLVTYRIRLNRIGLK